MTEPTTDLDVRYGTAHRRWQDQDVEIAYETFGPRDGEPLLLVMGTGGQRYLWPEPFCALLVERGYQVTRFDHRDTGASTRFDHLGRPNQLRMWLRPATAAAYTLEDLADDAVAVLDDQGWAAAHLVGTSLGGMVAQTLACTHAARVRSLTSLSSTPAPRIGQARPATMLKLAKIVKNVPPDAEALARQMIAVAGVVGSPAYPTDADSLRGIAAQCFPRRNDLAAHQRHTAALVASGDRRDRLAAVTAPTLVLHGEEDPIIRPAAGRATAEAIPGAQLRMFPGMGHDLPRELWGEIADAVVAIAAR
jgi:pimeloyl-ACP methyl ester carboxylesterase